MKKKNLALRMSAFMMSALLVVGSAAPAYAAADLATEDQQTDSKAAAEAAETDNAGNMKSEESTESTTDTAAESEELEGDIAAGEQTNSDTESVTEENAATSENEALQEKEDAITSEEEGFQEDAGEQSTEEAGSSFVFGSSQIQLGEGSYSLPVALMNASSISNASMAGSCIAGDATLEVAADGSAKITVPLQSVTVGSTTAYASDWKFYKGDTSTEKTAAEYKKNSNGKVVSITFTIPDKTADGIYLNMYVDAMDRNQDAYLKLDYANAKAANLDTSALEESIAKADALEENTYTKFSWDKYKSTIDEAKTAAQEALAKKTSQTAIDEANKSLTDAMAKLILAGDPTSLQAVLKIAKENFAKLNEAECVPSYYKSYGKRITTAEKYIAGRYGQTSMSLGEKNLRSMMAIDISIYSTEDLEALVKKAEALNKADYTEESWKKADLTTVIAAANKLIAKSSGNTKSQVKAAEYNLKDAMEKLEKVVNEVTVGRGQFEQKLTPGSYSLPVELLNGSKIKDSDYYTSADYMTYTSAAAGCFSGPATLVIHEDGTATMTVGIQAISAFGENCAASEWSIYEDTEAFFAGKSSTCARYSAHVDATKVYYGKEKPSQISFTVPDLQQNVVAVNMYVEAMTWSPYQSACIGLDWSNIKKVSDETSATSTIAKEYIVAPDLQTQLSNMKSGSTVKLTEDLTLTEDLDLKGGTLDLNGYTLNQDDYLLRITGDVSIIDSSSGKTGKLLQNSGSGIVISKSSILVQKGSFTADGVYIDGQIGNYAYGTLRQDVEEVVINLKNCTLTRSTYNDKESSADGPIYFESYQNGIDINIDSCTIDGNISVPAGNGDIRKIVVANSMIGSLDLSVQETSITNTKVKGGTSTVSARELTLSNDDFVGLSISAAKDFVLENVNSECNQDSSAMSALYLENSAGQATIKGGSFVSQAGSAVVANGAPVLIESGYFKGGKASISGPYSTPDGMILGDVTEGEYAGYQTLVEGSEADVENPVAIIYKEDGSIAKKISADDVLNVLAYAKSGQTVQLSRDINVENSIYFYKDITLDLNGHTLTASNNWCDFRGQAGSCHVVDSSQSKSGKLTIERYVSGTIILDGVKVEAPYVYGYSYLNGTLLSGVSSLTGFPKDCVITMADSVENPATEVARNVRASQYTITQTGDRTFSIKENELGTAMRAFEDLDEASYTKASYAAAKEIYDAIDASADSSIQGDVVAEKAKTLNDSLNALVLANQEQKITGLKTIVSKKYGDKAFTLGVKAKTELTYKSFNTKVATVDSKGKVTVKTPGTAKITVTAAQTEEYKGATAIVTIKVAKATPTIKTKVSKKTLKYKSLKKKSLSFSLGASANSKGKISCKKVSGLSKIKVSSSGKITLKKGMKKGSYKVKIKVSAKAKGYYNAGSKTVTVTVKVK